MKKSHIFFLFGIIAITCNSETQTKDIAKDTMQTKRDSTRTSAIQQTSCYQYNVQRDTIRLQLHLSGHKVSGTLDYNMYEKDDRHGTINGTLNGEIIKADYTYKAEGTTSVQEVMFKLKGDMLTEGTGEITERDNKFVFKDSAKVEFKQRFERVKCE